MKTSIKITIIFTTIGGLFLGLWAGLDPNTKCRLIYGKNICNFYEMMDIMAYDHLSDDDFNRIMQLCGDMEEVPKKDSCFEYVAQMISFWDFERAKQACDEIIGYDLVHDKESCYQKIQMSREESPFFEVIKRIPEGTKSGFVQEDKVVHGPLDRISVSFNRDINQNTLTKETFYALQGIDEKVPCTIEYNEESETASLAFDQEIEGGSPGQETRITVIVDGIKDLEGNQIEYLLYNIDIIKGD